jgi:hypothetical protein
MIMMKISELSRYNHLVTLENQYNKREWFVNRLWGIDKSKHKVLIDRLFAEMFLINWMKKQRGHFLRLTQNTLKSYGLHTA